MHHWFAEAQNVEWTIVAELLLQCALTLLHTATSIPPHSVAQEKISISNVEKWSQMNKRASILTVDHNIRSVYRKYNPRRCIPDHIYSDSSLCTTYRIGSNLKDHNEQAMGSVSRNIQQGY